MSTSDCLTWDVDGKALSAYTPSATLRSMPLITVRALPFARGSVALWFAEHYPNATVRGVSNSNSQREWIMARAAERGLTNLKIYTGNIVRA